MVNEHLLVALVFAGGFILGAVAAFPTDSRDNKIKAEGAVAVYEGRAMCEKALGQWVCSIPKN